MARLSNQQIGFVGLGLMGAPMAHNLLTAGAKLTVFNRSSDKMAPLVEAGAVAAKDLEDLSHQVEAGIIIVCVTDTAALEHVISGSHNTPGLADTVAKGALVIDMGTSQANITRQLAVEIEKRGADFIDAPVSGGEIGAKDGNLTIMAGGHEHLIEHAGPIFEILGKSWTHIGPIGSGQVAKTANQLIVGATLVAVAEGLAVAKRAGADPAKVREALLGGFAQSRVLELHGQRMLDQDFEPGGRAFTQLKDLNDALALARQSDIELPNLEQVTELWRQLVEKGHGGLDQAGIYRLIDPDS